MARLSLGLLLIFSCVIASSERNGAAEAVRPTYPPSPSGSTVKLIWPVALLVMMILFSSQTAKAADGSPSPHSSRSDIREVRLARLGCLSACPMYRLTFRSDGSAIYYGAYRVPRYGEYVGHVDFQMIAAWLDSEHIDKFQSFYGPEVLDGDPVTLTIVRSDRTNQIDTELAQDLPAQVVDIEKTLDGFSNRVDWRPAGQLESFLGIFVDQSHPGTLAVLSFFADLYANDSGHRADGGIEILTRDRCVSGGLKKRDVPLSVRLVKTKHIVTLNRAIQPPCTMPCTKPIKAVGATTSTGSISIDVDGHWMTFRRVTWQEYVGIEHEFTRGVVTTQARPSTCPSPSGNGTQT